MDRQRNNKNVSDIRQPGNRAAAIKTPKPRLLAAGVCAFLVLAVFLVFGQTVRHEFVNFDDPLYVFDTPQVTGGPTLEHIRWAFHTDRAGNWHPLTWLSLMLDSRLSGTRPWAYHLTNVLLHATAAVVLFLALWRMTGALWPAAFCAMLFAVHPLRAESVAWISERKDVLSGLFFMLALAAYAGYARRPSLIRYWAVTACFVLGLMSKPAVVTLPFVLLLLDYWPLGTWWGARDGGRGAGTPVASEKQNTASNPQSLIPNPSSPAPRPSPPVHRLLLEKIPWFMLSAASCVISPIAQGNSMFSLDKISLGSRVANALVSYVMYVVHFFYPAGLSAFYPHPGPSLPLWSWQPMAAAALLIVISGTAICFRKRFSWLFVGWFWYCGMLMPMIGLVQVGSQAMADRYTYLSQIGLAIAVAWTTAQVAATLSFRRLVQAAAATAVVGLMVLAWAQTSYWHDSITLWSHALECEPVSGPQPKNALAHNQLGIALSESPERIEPAIDEFRRALAINPNYPEALLNLGALLEKQANHAEAIVTFRRCLSLNPDDEKAACSLAASLARSGQSREAINLLQGVLRRDSESFRAHARLGDIYVEQGRVEDAAACFQKMTTLRPDDADARYNYGMVLNRLGKTADAIAAWRETIRLRPEDIGALDQLAWMLATHPAGAYRNGAEATKLAQRAVQLTDGRDVDILATLAAAHAECGRFSEAVATIQQAIALAASGGNQPAADAFRRQLKIYRGGSAYREAPDRQK